MKRFRHRNRYPRRLHRAAAPSACTSAPPSVVALPPMPIMIAACAAFQRLQPSAPSPRGKIKGLRFSGGNQRQSAGRRHFNKRGLPSPDIPQQAFTFHPTARSPMRVRSTPRVAAIILHRVPSSGNREQRHIAHQKNFPGLSPALPRRQKAFSL